MTATVENNVEFVRKTVSGAALNNIVSLPPTLRNIQVEIIVMPAVNDLQEKPQGNALNIGFWDSPPLASPPPTNASQFVHVCLCTVQAKHKCVFGKVGRKSKRALKI